MSAMKVYTICLRIAVLALAITSLWSTVWADSVRSLRAQFDFIVRSRDAETVKQTSPKKGPAFEISPLGYAANGFLTIYQTAISSQDQSVCNFTPSCSHFAREAINRGGFIKGSLLAFDRLTRCHPYARLMYKLDPRTERALDPVDDYLCPSR